MTIPTLFLIVYNTIIDDNFYDQNYADVDGYIQNVLVRETYMYEARPALWVRLIYENFVDAKVVFGSF